MFNVGKLTILALLCVVSVTAQAQSDFEQRVRAAMAPSIEKQRASVQKQALAAQQSTIPAPAAISTPTAATPGAVTAPATQDASIPPLPTSGFFTTPWPAPAGFAASVQAACDPMAKDKLDLLVADAAKKHGVSSDLVNAVINQESGARPCAVSPKGAQGLMQLMPATATQFGVSDPFDAKQNIEAGAALLKQLLTKYNGDVSLALGAYNAGSARVDAAGGIPAIPETINYVRDVLSKTPTQQ